MLQDRPSARRLDEAASFSGPAVEPAPRRRRLLGTRAHARAAEAWSRL